MGIYLKDITLVRNAGTPWETKVLDSVSLQIRPGRAVGLVGNSGAGKSSLLRVIAGLTPVTGGSYENRLGKPVGLVFQEPHRGFFAASVWDEVAYGPESLGCPVDEVKRRTSEALSRVKLPPVLWDKSPFRLSGGEQRRLALATALAMAPKALLLDEPTIGLDRFGREMLYCLIREERRRQDHLVVIASHDPELLFSLTDELILLHRGKLVFHASWSAWREFAGVLTSYGARLPAALQAIAKLPEDYGLKGQEIGTPEAALHALKLLWKGRCKHGRT